MRLGVSDGPVRPFDRIMKIKAMGWGSSQLVQHLSISHSPRFDPLHFINQVWKRTPVIPALKRYGQEALKVNVILPYVMSWTLFLLL